jgi:hypothetical protein
MRALFLGAVIFVHSAGCDGVNRTPLIDWQPLNHERTDIMNDQTSPETAPTEDAARPAPDDEQQRGPRRPFLCDDPNSLTDRDVLSE